MIESTSAPISGLNSARLPGSPSSIRLTTTLYCGTFGAGNRPMMEKWKTFTLKPGLVFEYEVILAIGTVEQIQRVFGTLQKEQSKSKVRS